MAFELFEKGTHNRCMLNDNELSVSKSSITFGKSISEKLLKKGYAEVYLDRIQNRVGLKPTSDNMKGFKISSKEDKSISMTGSFIKLLPRGKYKTYIEDTFICFDVSEIANKIEIKND